MANIIDNLFWAFYYTIEPECKEKTMKDCLYRSWVKNDYHAFKAGFKAENLEKFRNYCLEEISIKPSDLYYAWEKNIGIRRLYRAFKNGYKAAKVVARLRTNKMDNNTTIMEKLLNKEVWAKVSLLGLPWRRGKIIRVYGGRATFQAYGTHKNYEVTLDQIERDSREV